MTYKAGAGRPILLQLLIKYSTQYVFPSLWPILGLVSYNNIMNETDSNKLLISALEKNLSLSVEERIEAHENARKLVEDLKNAKKEPDAGSQEAS